MRRLSERLAEGDRIAVIACVRDAAAARLAEAHGARALAIDTAVAGIREATTLPLLWIGDGEPVDADAVAVAPGNDGAFGELEAVLRVDDEDGLEAALDRHDPAMFLLDVPSRDEDVDPLESVLDLLQNVPAGKLAIAGVEVGNRDEADTLERAGFDAVLASASRIADVVGSEPPEV